MKSLILAPIAFLLPLASGLNLVKRDNPAVLSAPIQRKHVSNAALRDRLRHERRRIQKRSGTVTETLTNDLTLYWANVTIGTPSQTIALHIDTGSSDLWVNAPNSTLCEEYSQDCDESGVYTAASSSTYAYVNSHFNITYADSSGAAGVYATDDVTIGSATLDNLQFGIGYTSTSTEGVLGIGYSTNEALVSYGSTYKNLPLALVSAGYIATNAYSLFLDDLNSSTGSILFGGVNTAKYSGTLSTIPIFSESNGEYAEFIVALTSLGRNNSTTSLASGTSIEALLDSGTSLTYLPEAVTNSLYKTYSATYDSSLGAAVLSCSHADSTDNITYTFSGVTIVVPMSELVLVAGTEHGQEICIFGIASSDDDTLAILGDTFLRSAYVVYDLANNEISLAQASYSDESGEVLQISSEGVPDAVTVTTAASTVSATSTGVGRVSSGAAALVTLPPVAAFVVVAAVGMGAMLVL